MRPIYYMNQEIRVARHRQWVGIVREEEAKHQKQIMNVSVVR